MMLRTRAWTMILTSQLHQSSHPDLGAALVTDTPHLTSAPRFCHRQMMTLLLTILARLVHPGLLCNLFPHRTEADPGLTSLLHHIAHLHRSHAHHLNYQLTTTTEADLVTTTTSHWHNKTNHFNLNNSTSTTRNNLLHNHMMTNHLATTPWTMATQSTMATMWKQRKITTTNFSTTSTLLLFLQLQLQFNNANFNDYNHLQLTTLQLQSTMCTTPSNGILR